MPLLDAYIPAGALTPAAEAQLLSTLTDLLITHEGADPVGSTPEQWSERFRNEVDRWAKVAKSAGLAATN